ncbi:Ubiquinone biosynthesis O-methyltransferase [Penicillium griseofulvum]|uniref:Ubiquinone biosynthesis O-methyltransferase, mitochondrial n=1 Tax=Penicillium patulum TaxID=5078 RepID=A0A135LG35_PENPA|nr:Ubiquinone biosynthesis O-methyltransferase [Penicillium griseofulvum]KXG47941.1 Ubiquinone biosynthesis O-methyltransferase [Penicillium griseofulvum]
MASLRPRTLPLSVRSLRSALRSTRPSPIYSLSATAPASSIQTPPTRAHSTSSVSADELSHFSALASSWWDPMGPSRILHLMNPLRHEFIASCLAEGTPTPTASTPATATLNYLDVGCGGGIFAESLARTIPLDPTAAAPTPTLAASMTAIDPSTDLIQMAREHARLDPTVDTHLRTGRFKYLNTTLEDVLAGNAPISTSAPNSSLPTQTPSQYDIVTLFEVLEHIDPKTSTPLGFLTNCLRALKPGGWLIGSTISRTLPSFILNQVIAEAPWPIGVVPRGTHEWGKFVNPDEVKGWLQEGLMRAADTGVSRGGSAIAEGMRWKCVGAIYVPGIGWKMVPGSEDWGNYFWAVRKEA